MKPRDFVARVISLFDFTMPFGVVKAGSFYEAQLYIRQTLGTSEALRLDLDGYRFHLETASLLGHQVVRATMAPATEHEAIMASVCFTIQDYETGDITDPENIYDRYQLSKHYRRDEMALIDMLVYLTLKTNNAQMMKFS